MVLGLLTGLFDLFYVWLNFTLDFVWLGGNPLNPLQANIPPYIMTPETLVKFQTAMSVSYEVQWRGVQETDDISVYQDFTDKSIIVFRDGVCYAAWQGSIVSNIFDSGQSWPILQARACGEGGCCIVEQGLLSAYNSEYLAAFEATMEGCYNRCDGGCPVVLTGHSQGATIAPVAAILLAKYNPMLITFGQHRVVRYNCDYLNNLETYLRVVSMCPQNGEPAYDLNAHVFGSIVGRHTGTMIMVGDGGAATLGYNTDMWFNPVIEPCHNIHDPYTSSINKLTAGPLDGYVEGSLCTRHIECKSKICSSKRCAAA